MEYPNSEDPEINGKVRKAPVTEAHFKRVLLRYEVAGSWWSGFISWDWLQDLAASYFAGKVNRKFRRLKCHEEFDEPTNQNHG